MASIRVLIVDRQALFRESLSAVLAAQDAFVVVGEAGDATTAARLAAKLTPDVIVTDLHLPDARGAAVVARLLAAQSDARIIALTALTDEETVAAAVAAGVQGYVPKSQHTADLIQAICTVAQGGTALDPLVTPIIWRRFQQLTHRHDPGGTEALSSFERDVLGLLAGGQTTRQIAGKLSTTPAAVEKAVAEACEKLHARNRTEAAVIAFSRGLVSTR
jgi:DNA-binding NarL/FixJ family response regulator